MNKNCRMGLSKEPISLSRRESPSLWLCFRFILLPTEAKGFEIIREIAGVGVVTHQYCSSVIPRTATRNDLSKSSAEQIDFDTLQLLYMCLLTALALQWRSQSWVLGCVTQTEEFCITLLTWTVWRYRYKNLFHGAGLPLIIVMAFSFSLGLLVYGRDRAEGPHWWAEDCFIRPQTMVRPL